MKASLKIKDNKYYAVINYKDGEKYKQKWITLGLPVKNNKRKAEALLEEIIKTQEESYCSATGGMMFTEYIKQWLVKKKPLIELSTWEGYQIYAERHIIPYFEPLNLSLRDVKPKHIQEYYQYKYSTGRLDGKPGGLSIPAIKKHGIILKEVLNDAVLEEHIIRNPAIGVKLPAKETHIRERVFLTNEEANALLKAFENNPLRDLIYVTLYYGLRRSEVLGLKWSAIDFEHGTLTVNHTVVKNRTIVRKDKTKTESSASTFNLIDDVRKVLLHRLDTQAENRRLFGDEYFDSDYIFTWPDGTLYRPDYITKSFEKAVKQYGLKPMRFHDLRHSTASILYDMGWDLKDSQTWLRHASVEMTGDVYTHISEDRKKKLANTLNSTFKI